jgi:ABC-type enterochelin transport system substrate-binding protein
VASRIESETTGLRKALEAERDQRKGLEKSVKDLQAQATAGSELATKLADLQAQLAGYESKATESERELKFVRAAAKLGVRDPELAYLAALRGDHFDKLGDPDWDALKKAHPDLFAPAGRGDTGSGGQQPPVTDMNALLRRSAGM